MDAGGEYVMPWVFTHAIKDYYDMPYIALKKKVRVTFNIVPSLIVQLKDYSNFDVNDRFLNYIKKSQKSEYEYEFVLDIIKSTSYKLSVKSNRFTELIQKKDLTPDELNDLETLFLLVHCGDYLRQNNEIVKELVNKNHFSYQDKILLLDELHRFISKIIPFYKNAYKDDAIEISTTPFYHPILPILFDVSSIETLKKPNMFADFRNDAKWHIKKAIELFESEFDKKPNGMWPSEGSVSKETVELFNDYGVKWIATDEAILKKTNPELSPNKRYVLNGVNVVFRNREISDKIGFKYQFLKTKDAIDDFKQSLKDVNIIIMDGENAWEYYSNPKEFLEAMYDEVIEYECMSIGEFAKYEKIKQKELKTIASGSWINADFSIWIGDEEKNRAWELLSRAKMALDNKKDKKALELLHQNEGSDWFWWYGNTNYTKHKSLYDYIFRSRIAAIYKILNLSISDIYEPLIKKRETNRAPVSFIKPKLNGKINFFKYANAGLVDFKSSAIYSDLALSRVKYGYDDEFNLYLALFFEDKNINLIDINGKKYNIKKGVFDGFAYDRIFEVKLEFCDFVEISVFKDDKCVQKVSFDVKTIEYRWLV
jgi:alpha-amylase/alpha-mannosidase (GH57 family)